MGLVVTGATEGIRRTAQRTVDHFQQLNEQFPPHTAEGHFLDRIEMAALTASSVLTKSYLEMKAVIKRAKAVLDKLERGGKVEDHREPTFVLDSQDTGKMKQMAQRTRERSHRYWLLPPGAVRDDGVCNPIFEEELG